MLRTVIATACVCAAGTAGAEPSRMSGQQISDLVAGSLIELDTPLGTKLPVRYHLDGQLSGRAGDLAPYLGAASDSGRWWVASDQLCHQWKHWFEAKPQCLRLKKEGRTIHWRAQDGNTGTAAVAIPGERVQVAALTPRSAESRLPEGLMRLDAPASAMTAEPMPTPAAAEPEPGRPAPAMSTAAEAKPKTPAVKVAVATVRAKSVVATPAAAKPGPMVSEARSAAAMETAEAQPAEPARTGFIVANVEEDDVLNVRRGPSAETEVVGALQPGSRGIAMTGECRSMWCPISYEATSGWVNRMYLASEEAFPSGLDASEHRQRAGAIRGEGDVNASNVKADNVKADNVKVSVRSAAFRDPPDAPRTCLTPAARALLERIEDKFGPVKLVSTCRPGATIAGSGRPSKHASGNAIDFNAGSRKGQIVDWLIATHHDGGTMTYADMDHIHVDIGPHFVSIAGGRHWASWNHRSSPDWSDRMSLSGRGG